MIAFTPEQRIVVTGASSGIGRATALLLHTLGATVIAQGRDAGRLQDLRDSVRHPERLHTVVREFAQNLGELPAWVLSISHEYGKLSGLAFCAGQTWNRPMQTWNMDEAHTVFDLCCHAPLLVARGFCDRRVNTGAGASAVFIAAAAAVNPNPGQGMYSAAKAALVAGVKCLAKEVASSGLRANCISPGLVNTPMMDATVAQLGTSFLEREVPQYPLGLGEVSDVAQMTAFLLSGASRWITGQNVLLTGGR